MRNALFGLVVTALIFGGCGPVKDMHAKREARTELERRAEDGHVASQYELGRRYGSEKGSSHLAIYWLCRAAVQGHTGAQYTLAGLYERRANEGIIEAGRGKQTLNDKGSAYFWYTAAAGQGHERAFAARESLESKMSPQVVADAKRRARAWRQAQCIR